MYKVNSEVPFFHWSKIQMSTQSRRTVSQQTLPGWAPMHQELFWVLGTVLNVTNGASLLKKHTS